eukprot:scpid112253/ scgid17907/ 
MEYTTEEELPTSAPTSRRPLTTTVQTGPTTSIYILTGPRNTPLPPTLDTTEITLQPTSELPTNSNSVLTNPDKIPVSPHYVSTIHNPGTDKNKITTTHGATTLPTVQSTSASLIAESTNYIWIIG